MRNNEPAVLEVKNMQDFLKQLNATPSAKDFREERSRAGRLFSQGESVESYCKPIQETPMLEGIDAERVVEQVMKLPSKQSIERNERMLRIRKEHGS